MLLATLLSTLRSSASKKVQSKWQFLLGNANVTNAKHEVVFWFCWVLYCYCVIILSFVINRWGCINDILLTQKSTHWNPRASVRRVTESQPSVPVNLTWNWQGRKQSQIRERIDWDSEYLSDGRIGKLCRYYKRQKDIKCKRIVNERIGRISRYTKRQNRLWTADHVCMTRSNYECVAQMMWS